MTLNSKIINTLHQNGMIWEIEEDKNGRVNINIFFVNNNLKICIADADNHKDAVNFIADLKRAGIIVS